jgi:hypothetical protein
VTIGRIRRSVRVDGMPVLGRAPGHNADYPAHHVLIMTPADGLSSGKRLVGGWLRATEPARRRAAVTDKKRQ